MTEPQAHSDDAILNEGLVPIIVGVTGHRDLVPEEMTGIRTRVRKFFLDMRKQFPDRPVHVLSPLAEGADRLVAEIALELGMRVTAPLPMAKELYIADFASAESRAEFERLVSLAESVYELPPAPGLTVDEIARPGEARNRQYAQLGVYLCAHSHVLLALWDGKPSPEVGGTAQVVRFHHDDVMAGFGEADPVSRQLLADDESDLVYHIVVSRSRDNGAPLSPLKPLEVSWFTSDDAAPRSAELPETYRRVFDRTSEFNRDSCRYRHRILTEAWSLAEPDVAERLPVDSQRIDLLFRAADWLAILNQQRLFSTLRVTHTLVFIMGSAFIVYSDVDAQLPFMLTFFVCLAAAVGLNLVAAAGGWHSRYLEYRALAEGLRIQFYWAVAGITDESATKYSYDNFLQKQDIELGWIRNVMRAGGIGCDAAPSRDQQGLSFVVREWIGDDAKIGQLSYYRRKTAQLIERNRKLDRLGQLVGVVVSILFVAMVFAPSANARNPLFVAVGLLLLSVSVRKAYSYRTAEKEVIKQYEFMYKIFRNARHRLDRAETDDDRRRILRALGEAALDEHAEWILLHRERPLERGNLLRMEA